MDKEKKVNYINLSMVSYSWICIRDPANKTTRNE